MFRTREEIEQHELEWLASYAEKSALSRGREFDSKKHAYRTEFQKDRDRIIHTTAYRRLQYKTQVFINYEGDYYRTRLTHTNEAAQIARTMARALRANEDLVEAITLAHDLGHSPFGHSGEATLDRLMLQRMGLEPGAANAGRGFNHTVQTLRIVERLEKRWSGFDGLNLTWETREGIVKHATEYDEVGDAFKARFMPELRGSLEAQIVNQADELTYSAHDLDDGLRAGLLDPKSAELQAVTLWREVWDPEDDFSELTRHRLIRRLVNNLVTDMVQTTAARLMALNPQSPDDVRRAPDNVVAMSPEMEARLRELKDFLYEHLYSHPRVIRMFRKAERVLVAIFEAFEEDYRQLPPQTRARVREILRAEGDAAGFPLRACRVICDYIAGMTDRYALEEHRRLFDPFERA